MTAASLPEPLDALAPRHDIPRKGRSGFMLVDHRQVHFLEWGHGGLPPVLALHGGGQTAYMFEDLGAALGTRYHIVAPDLPDHGDSDGLGAPVTSRSNGEPQDIDGDIDGDIDDDIVPEARGSLGPEAIAASLPPLLSELGMPRAALVGASLGGLTSIRFAASHPAAVGAVVLIDVGHRLEADGVKRIIDFMRAHESFGSLDEAAVEISKYLPQRQNVRPETLSRNLRQRGDGRWIWKHGFSRRVRGVGDDLDPTNYVEYFLSGVREAAASITCPVLVLRGAASDVLSQQGAEEVAALIPDSQLATVERAGHLAAGDNPHSTVNLISAFLDSHTW